MTEAMRTKLINLKVTPEEFTELTRIAKEHFGGNVSAALRESALKCEKSFELERQSEDDVTDET